MKNILFICTGNTCRSSMAEGILKKILRDVDKENQFKVDSAGTAVFLPEPANRKAIEVMREMGIDITHHQAQPLTISSINHADLILTMTEDHKNQVLSISPQAENKVYTLLEYITDIEHNEIMKQMVDLEDEIDSKKNIYIEKYGHEVLELIQKREKLNDELEETNLKLKKYSSEVKEFIRKDISKLRQLEEHNYNITDPFGKSLPEYRLTAVQLKEALEKLLEKIK